MKIIIDKECQKIAEEVLDEFVTLLDEYNSEYDPDEKKRIAIMNFVENLIMNYFLDCHRRQVIFK